MAFLAARYDRLRTEDEPAEIILVTEHAAKSNLFGGERYGRLRRARDHAITTLERLERGGGLRPGGRPLHLVFSTVWAGLDGKTLSVDYTGYQWEEDADPNRTPASVWKKHNPESYKWITHNGLFVAQTDPVANPFSCMNQDRMITAIMASIRGRDSGDFWSAITRAEPGRGVRDLMYQIRDSA